MEAAVLRTSPFPFISLTISLVSCFAIPVPRFDFRLSQGLRRDTHVSVYCFDTTGFGGSPFFFVCNNLFLVLAVLLSSFYTISIAIPAIEKLVSALQFLIPAARGLSFVCSFFLSI